MTTVLIVDDESLVLGLVARVLSEAGYETLTCEGGRAALEFIAECNGAVDVLLTDVRMPDVNGRAVASALRARWPWAGVVYMSGYCGRAKEGEPLFTHDDCFLQKPFSLPALSAAIDGVHHCPAMYVA
jgi:two-component system cell cycle sensor histidine kinase/response regulator CckA